MIYVKRAYLIIIIALTASLIAYSIMNSADDILKTDKNAVYSKNTVVIDAGHGGGDPGTIGTDGTYEKEINLNIAQDLFDFLMVSGINAMLIRNTDTEYYPKGSDTNKSDLYNRLDFVNSVEKSILISIHQNHYQNESATGAQIFYSVNNDKSKVLADKILPVIKKNLQPDNKRENEPSGSAYYILYKASAPSIMIECGFMSNPKENSDLKTTNYQKGIAFSVLEGICEDV